MKSRLSTAKLKRVFYTKEALNSDDFLAVADCEYNSLLYGSATSPESLQWIAVRHFRGYRKTPPNSSLKFVERIYQVNKAGQIRAIEIEEMLPYQPTHKSKNYVKINVKLENKDKKVPRDLHRLVMLAFDRTGFDEKGSVIRHLTHTEINHLNALAWGTQKQNMDDKVLPPEQLPSPDVEIWQHVYYPEYKCPAIGLFVSNKGNVKKVTTSLIAEGKYYYKKGKREGTKKHCSVQFHDIGKPKSESETVLIHRLVFEAFGTEEIADKIVCHSDGDPHKNSIEDIRLGTHQDNSDDKRVHGTLLKGDSHPNSKVTERQVEEIRKRRAEGANLKVLSRCYGISESTISAICTRPDYRCN